MASREVFRPERKIMVETDKKPTNKEMYNPLQREAYWQLFWEAEKINKFDPNSSSEVFSIDTPPPTISGALHLGHVYSYSQAEVIARYRKMAGFSVRYPMGFDDNGLPTERLVEKERNIKGRRMPAEEFSQICLDVTNQYIGKYTDLWKSLGLSVDWGLEYSSISKNAQTLAQTAFKELHEKGAIYQKEAVSLYCPNCLTSIAQAEVEDQEVPSVFYDLAFKKDNSEDLIVSTTRPELLPSCVAIFVNPSDKRYSELKGTKVKTPFDTIVPVLTDEKVSVEKGTGAVMCCTYGDETDLYWVRKHKLQEQIIIDRYGKFVSLEAFPELGGKSIIDARKIIVEKLKSNGSIKSEKNIVHTIGVHERCSTPIELIPTRQWFVKILDKKEELIKAGDKIKWYPSYMKKRYQGWIEGLKWDWCISRERFFGVPIPAYTCDSCEHVSIPDVGDFPVDFRHDEEKHQCPDCGKGNLQPEKDVLDTWFTSSLTPDINNNHSANGRLKGQIYPMSMRPQGHDIIRTWVVYSVLMGLYRHNEIPWHELMVSGHVLLRKGEKISKRTGGGKLKPEELIRTSSADAVRYAMFGATLGQDSYFDEQEVLKGKKLVNKIYNAGKLVLSSLKDYPLGKSNQNNIELKPIDKWIIQNSIAASQGMAKELEKYEYSKARRIFEDFFWKDFCDNYLEIVKGRMKATEGTNDSDRLSAQYALYNTYLNSLKMISPFMPHISEEMFHASVTDEGIIVSDLKSGFFMGQEKRKSIHLTNWPSEEKVLSINDKDKQGIELMLQIISKVRKYKSEQRIASATPLGGMIFTGTDEQRKLLDSVWSDLVYAARSPEIIFLKKGESPPNKDYSVIEI